jgi:hypothetical protein
MVLQWRAEPIDGVGESPEVINGVTASGGRAVAVGVQDSKAATWRLRDGAWQAVPISTDTPEGQVNGISPFRGTFLAVGGIEGLDGRDAAAWEVSLDGALTPTGAFDLPGDQIINKGFPLPGEGILGVGQNEGDGAVWFSEDGDNWVLQPDDADELGGPGRQALLRAGRFKPVDESAEMLIAVGYEERGSDEDGAVWISEDRSSWRRVPSDAFGGDGNQRIIDVTGNENGGVVAVGYADSGEGDLDAAIWTSGDGAHWERLVSDVLGGPKDQKIQRLMSPSAGSGLPMFIAGGSDASRGTLDAALWYFDDGELMQKQRSVGTPLGGEGDQEILSLLRQPGGILAVGRDSGSGDQLAAIWYGE